MSEQEIADRFSILDKAARKSDRWWFLALMMIGMVFVALLLQWGQGQLALRDARIDKLNNQLVEHLTTTNVALSVSLAAAVKATDDNTRMLARVEAALTNSNSPRK